MKTESWIIKRDNGFYLNIISENSLNVYWKDKLLNAYLFESYLSAYEISEQLKVFSNINCKPVKIEIREVEE